MENAKLITYTIEINNGIAFNQVRLLPTDRSKQLKEMYKILHCDLVDVITIMTEGHAYDLWFDEEFLLKHRPILTLIVGEPKKNAFTPICGNILIAKSDEEGEMEGLNAEDIARVKRWIRQAIQNLDKAWNEGLFHKA